MIIVQAREIKVAMPRSLVGQNWSYPWSYPWSYHCSCDRSYQGKAKDRALRTEGAPEFAVRFIDSPDEPGLVYLGGSDF